MKKKKRTYKKQYLKEEEHGTGLWSEILNGIKEIKLLNVIDGIASKLNTKARYSQFSEEYILSNVDVNKLKEIGFEFVGYDNANKYDNIIPYLFEKVNTIRHDVYDFEYRNTKLNLL